MMIYDKKIMRLIEILKEYGLDDEDGLRERLE